MFYIYLIKNETGGKYIGYTTNKDKKIVWNLDRQKQVPEKQ